MKNERGVIRKMGNHLFLSVTQSRAWTFLIIILMAGSPVLSSQAKSALKSVQNHKIITSVVKFKTGKILPRGKMIRTQLLTITGSGNKSNQVADFKPVQIRTQTLTMQGQGDEAVAVKSFTAVKLITRQLTLTGTYTAPTILSGNGLAQTTIFTSPSKLAVKSGSLSTSNVIRTRPLTITGKDNQINQAVIFTPVRIKTQALTITGSGITKTTVTAFTPKNIRTKTLTITGKSSSKH